MSVYENGPGPLPDRWLYCPRRAEELIVNKFLAFKTPLSSKFDNEVPLENRFPPSMIFDICRVKKIKLGLWLDLTNTSRFYDKEEVLSQGCKYVKLKCRGHGECPSKEQTKFFINLVHEFISQNPLSSIAIHCTHGFNRTGFLIASYLIEKYDCSVECAMKIFSEARSPGIYKADYILELYRRYDDPEEAPPPPERPDWEMEAYSRGQIGSTDEGASTSGNSTKRSGGPRFMEGVPGVTLCTEQSKVRNLQKKVQIMCDWKRKEFPGCQPVTMSMENLQLLKEKPYMVSWKADGMRYLMLIDGPDDIYFFDRDNNVFQVSNLRFPVRKNLEEHLRDTLLDGEMVIDKVEGNNIPRYLVYDIVKYMGQEVGKTPFSTVRMVCIEKEIIQSREIAKNTGLINRADEPFSVRRKEFFPLDKTEYLLGPFAKSLPHEPDGLIFQPAIDPYVPGRCDSVLKWKPIELNSIDFRMRIETEKKEGCIKRKVIQLYVGQLRLPFANMKYTKELKDLDGKIIECKFENNEWVFMRERTDKSFPNSFNTAASVFKSIKKPLTKEALLMYIGDSLKMPPPSEPPSKRIKR